MFDKILHKYIHIPYTLHVQSSQKPKRSRATIVLLHGIGNSSAAWDQVIARLPNDVHVVSIDLLGHGMSPRPNWPRYDAAVQARAVMHTLARMPLLQQPIIVGHSMGALVAVEFTKRYPLLVKSLVLCSPPFYIDQPEHQRSPDRNKMLKNLYIQVRRYPEKFTSIAAVAAKLRLLSPSFHVDESNVDIYMAALEASIINQTAFKDVIKLKKSVQILHGALDPVVIRGNLDEVTAQNKNVSLKTMAAGHEITGQYVTAVVSAINGAL